jgi:hypothetical protein
LDYTTRIVGFPLRKAEYGRAKWNLIHITQEILVPFGNHHKKKKKDKENIEKQNRDKIIFNSDIQI